MEECEGWLITLFRVGAAPPILDALRGHSNSREVLYGVPANLDLTPFVNTMLQRIDFGPYIIHFNFDGEGTLISVEGDWELRDSSGKIIDANSEDPEKAYRLPLLAGKTVTSTRVDAPASISLIFDSGHELRIFDNSKDFESFSIQPGDIFI